MNQLFGKLYVNTSGSLGWINSYASKKDRLINDTHCLSH